MSLSKVSSKDGLTNCPRGEERGVKVEGENTKKRFEPKTSIERCKFPLGKSIYAVVNEFGGELYVHLRHYHPEKQYPTATGIGLTLRRWKEVTSNCTDLVQRVDGFETLENDYRHHLGGNHYVSVTQGFPCVDFRRFWMPEGAEEIRATRMGISLGFAEFRNLINLIPKIDSYLPELADVFPCFADHDNQEAYYQCGECNPNGQNLWD
jgi:hypothetical protein